MKKMIRNIGMMAITAAVLLNVSCRETKEDEPAPPMQHEMQEREHMEGEHMEGENQMEGQDQMGMQTSEPEFNVEAAATAYSHYLDIKTALVETDAARASQHAKSMLGKLEGTNVSSEVAKNAQKIAAADNVNVQREAFSELTKAMEPVLTSAINSGEIYKQYCPMAFEGKGDYWFSDSKEIRNPYFGDKMLTCGRMETIIRP